MITQDELMERGYRFTARHHHRKVEVIVEITRRGSSLPRYVETCEAPYRAKAMQAALECAVAHFVQERLA